MNDTILLSIRNLGISFKTERGIHKAVSGVSFDLKAGKTLAVVGESGSGKSVSTMSILQLLQMNKVIFDTGFFFFDSSVVGTHKREFTPEDEMLKELRGKGIAMIFQEPMTALNPVMKCGEQISEMLQKHLSLPYVEAKRRTIELFNEVKLPRAEQMFDQYPHQLSGGQRQRVMIAMAISCKPKILIADEPTTALDVTVQKGILGLLRSLQEKYNMGIIFITHDLGVVADIADNVVVMRNGQIVEIGEADVVLNHPKHPYTKGLLACRPVMGQKIERLKTVADFLQEDGLTPPVNTVPHSERKRKTIWGEKVLEVKNLSKIYTSSKGMFWKEKTEVRAVNDVSFSIGSGEVLGLVGESGCGKTTLSRMLLGLIPAMEGQIIFNGRDICELSHREMREVRKEMQIIFQDPYSSLNPKHTIGDSIMEPMMTFGLIDSKLGRQKKAIELLEKTGLGEEHLSRYPHEFSGGQRQRIVIARALACEPSFVVCDEAVSALDVSVQAQVLNLLNDLKHEYALTYLFISHDLSVVYHISDRIMVMNKGRVEEIGTYDEILRYPQSEYTKRLVSAVPGNSRA